MRRALMTLLAIAAASPALAQHSGHTQPAVQQARPAPTAAQATTCTPEHAAMGHCTLPAPPARPPSPAPAPTGGRTCTPEHAAMGHCTPQAAPPAGTPAPAPAPAGGQTCTPEHAALGHCTIGGGAAPPVAPPPPEALSGPVHAADTVFDPAVMRAARESLRAEHGDGTRSRFTIDQLELAIRNGREGFSWEDVQFWYGGDLNRLWVKSEGEGTFGEGVESAEFQALWSRAIRPYFDVQAGLRQDFGPGPDRTHLVLGIQGLAPYWFEVDGAVFLSTRGDVTARTEAEHDLRITQRLILQPRIEANFSLQDVPELGLGSGVTSADAGLRLRYEFVPEFAPYVGVQYERAFGDTADFRRAAGEDVGGWSLVMGLRAWF